MLNWLLSRGYQVVAKISNQGPGTEVAPAHHQIHSADLQPRTRDRRRVPKPHRFCRATRQWVIRTPKEKGRLSVCRPALPRCPTWSPAVLADAYDGRAMIEATFCQDKQALGLVKRR